MNQSREIVPLGRIQCNLALFCAGPIVELSVAATCHVHYDYRKLTSTNAFVPNEKIEIRQRTTRTIEYPDRSLPRQKNQTFVIKH